MQHENCIFCQIVSGDSSGYIIYEDELTITLLDIFPASQGHALIISKEHFDDIFAISPDILATVARNSSLVAKAIDKVIAPDGLGIHQFNKAAAGQTIFHYHLHLIPQWQDQSIGIHSKVAADSESLAALANKLKAAVDKLDKH